MYKVAFVRKLQNITSILNRLCPGALRVRVRSSIYNRAVLIGRHLFVKAAEINSQ